MKISAFNPLEGANVPGGARVPVAHNPNPIGSLTASTISIDETDNSINDSGGNLPIFPIGTIARVSGATDTAAEINADHIVVSSTANKLVVSTDFTVAEGAGASITVTQVNATYHMTLSELAIFIFTGGFPDPLTGVNLEDSSANRITSPLYDNGASGTFNYTNGDNQVSTLTSAGTVISFTNIPAGGIMRAQIKASDVYAPNVSGITPLLNADAVDFSAFIIIIAENFHASATDGDVKYYYGGKA